MAVVLRTVPGTRQFSVSPVGERAVDGVSAIQRRVTEGTNTVRLDEGGRQGL
jgi:hypothetical protein